MKKVSFDFDNTLTREEVLDFAKTLVDSGVEVWIVTSRFDNKTIDEKGWYWVKHRNNELFDVANICNIPKERIKFTNMESKSIFLKDKNFIFHLDDDNIELEEISNNCTDCFPVDVLKKDWKETCEKLIRI